MFLFDFCPYLIYLLYRSLVLVIYWTTTGNLSISSRFYEWVWYILTKVWHIIYLSAVDDLDWSVDQPPWPEWGWHHFTFRPVHLAHITHTYISCERLPIEYRLIIDLAIYLSLSNHKPWPRSQIYHCWPLMN